MAVAEKMIRERKYALRAKAFRMLRASVSQYADDIALRGTPTENVLRL
jgi:hypothetical protein